MSNESRIEPRITFAIKYKKISKLFLYLFLSWYIKYRIVAISLPSSKFSYKNKFIHLWISGFIIIYHKLKWKLFFYFIILIILSENVSKSIVSQFLSKIVIQQFLKWRLFVLDSFGQICDYPSTQILVLTLLLKDQTSDPWIKNPMLSLYMSYLSRQYL